MRKENLRVEVSQKSLRLDSQKIQSKGYEILLFPELFALHNNSTISLAGNSNNIWGYAELIGDLYFNDKKKKKELFKKKKKKHHLMMILLKEFNHKRNHQFFH